MESEPSSRPKLPLFSVRPEPPSTVTSPLHTSASVPFRWEEEPGKPRPCTNLITLPTTKSLELPPRLMIMESKMTKLPSPTTVLDGPGVMSSKQSRFSSFSFRLSREGQGQGWSFDSGNNRSPSNIISKHSRFSSFRLSGEGEGQGQGQGQGWSFDIGSNGGPSNIISKHSRFSSFRFSREGQRQGWYSDSGSNISPSNIISKHSRFSSFRLSRERQGQGQGQGQGWSNRSPEGGHFSPMVGEKRLGHKGRGLLGSWGKRALKVKGGKEEDVGLLGSWGQRDLNVKGEKEESIGGNLVFSSSIEGVGCGEVEIGKVEGITRNGSLSRLRQPRPHFWAAMYEGIKLKIPWRSRKSKREGFII